MLIVSSQNAITVCEDTGWPLSEYSEPTSCRNKLLSVCPGYEIQVLTNLVVAEG